MSYEVNYPKACAYCKEAKEVPSWKYCDREWCRKARKNKYETFLHKIRRLRRETH